MAEDSQHTISSSLLRLDEAVLDVIVAQKPLPCILESLCLKLEERSPGLLCSVLLLDPDGETLRHGAAPSLPPDYASAIDGAKIGPRAGSCGTAVHRRELVVVEDIASDPLWADYRDLALPRGLRACWSMPLSSREGVVLGTFACYYCQPRTPTANDLLMIEHAAHLACIAIEHSRTKTELQAAENRYRSLVERLPAITYMAEVGATGRWFFVSPQIETMLGYTPAEWTADPGLWMSRVHEDDREIALAAERRVQETGELFKADYRVCARDGSIRWFRDEGKILPEIAGEMPVMQGVLYDITDYKRLEEQLRQAQKMEAVGQLAGGVAHDFNNLLMIIQAHAERISEHASGGDELLADTVEIKNAVARASSLTQRLLAFGRKQLWQPRILDMSSVLRDVGGMIRRLLAEDIRLDMEIGTGLAPVRADRGQLEQAILNLALNARDAMSSGGELTIRAHNVHFDNSQTWGHSFAAPGDYVMVGVSDTGTGMSAETQAHMFEPFFTTKGPDKGTGLGLSTVYGVVQQSGGAILVDSEPNHGSTVKIFLPVCTLVNRREEKSTPAIAPAPAKETILLVEDLEAIRDMASDHLSQLGYHVLSASDGEAAIRLMQAQNEPIDLLISDIVMPNMGGRELARQLTKMCPKAKVLFMSGYPDGDVPGSEEALLDEQILRKPFSLKALATKARRMLDEGKAQ
jgi:PAS domain S-box-containing protein